MNNKFWLCNAVWVYTIWKLYTTSHFYFLYKRTFRWVCTKKMLLTSSFFYGIPREFFLFQRYSSFFDQIWGKKISNLYQKCLILCSKILLKMLHNTNLKFFFLPWQHAGFQTASILKAFLTTFGVLFWYLQMVPNVFRDENHLHIEAKWVGTAKKWVAMGTKCFIAVGVLSIELLDYQVSMVCAANWPRQLYLYTWCNIGLSVWHHQSSHLHILHIFQTFISPELMQVFANGKRHFLSFIEFFVIQPKYQEVKTWS